MGPGAAHRIYYEVQHTQAGPGKTTSAETSGYIGVKLGLGMLQSILSRNVSDSEQHTIPKS